MVRIECRRRASQDFGSSLTADIVLFTQTVGLRLHFGEVVKGLFLIPNPPNRDSNRCAVFVVPLFEAVEFLTRERGRDGLEGL